MTPLILGVKAAARHFPSCRSISRCAATATKQIAAAGPMRGFGSAGGATQELDTYSVGPAIGSGVSTIVVAERPGRRPSSSKI
jgi:hypothetical protein